MTVTSNPVPSAGYNFNQFEEIKSHSAILFNERLAILFYKLDLVSVEMNMYRSLEKMLETRAYLNQIYKNIRMLIRYNPTMRATLNLETKDEGTYIPDVVFGILDKMIEYCDNNGYTTKKLYIIINELNRLEVMIKDILQYYHYFIRPEFRQKPDIDLATEKYKEMADMRTIEELREIVGKRHKIDFESLGVNPVKQQEKIEYGDVVDEEFTNPNNAGKQFDDDQLPGTGDADIDDVGVYKV